MMLPQMKLRAFTYSKESLHQIMSSVHKMKVDEITVHFVMVLYSMFATLNQLTKSIIMHKDTHKNKDYSKNHLHIHIAKTLTSIIHICSIHIET